MSSKEFFTLAVDCMGGDHGPKVTLPACRHFLDTHPNARLQLVGQADALASFQHERAFIVEATEVVGMDDSVEVALRRKKDSSMRVAIELVKAGEALSLIHISEPTRLM
jgi:glycerol-3-phosphate acyltransferase PlsX